MLSFTCSIKWVLCASRSPLFDCYFHLRGKKEGGSLQVLVTSYYKIVRLLEHMTYEERKQIGNPIAVCNYLMVGDEHDGGRPLKVHSPRMTDCGHKWQHGEFWLGIR